MKISSILLCSLAGTALSSGSQSSRAKISFNDIPSDSDLGQRLLTKARRVGYNNANNYVNYFEYGQNDGYYYGGNNNGNNNNNNGDYSAQEWQWYTNYMLLGSSWLRGYSIKFVGCYDTLKWNEDAYDAEDVRLSTRHLVRFRLCPTSQCVPGYQEGCKSKYGDYLIDLDSFLYAYMEAKTSYDSWYNSNQQGGDDWGDYQNNNVDDGNYNKNAHYDNNFEVSNFLSCSMSDLPMDQEDYAQMYYNNQNYNNNQQYQAFYYIGPYCGEQGGEIQMGMFKDDACSIPADSYGGKNVYFDKTGAYLPFSDTSMIEFDCMSCEEPQGQYNQYNNAGDDNADPDYIKDFCEQAYIKAGKCEENLPKDYFNMYKQKNNKVCNYIEGLKQLRDDGSLITTNRKSPGHLTARTTGALLILFFGSALIFLGAYVYRLKSRFERASVELE